MVVNPINSYQEFQDIIKQDKLVVIDFWASWCGPCRVISPKFEEYSNIYNDADFFKVDVDEQAQISQEVGIRSMPTFLFFKKGSKMAEIVGANPVALKSQIEQLL